MLSTIEEGAVAEKPIVTCQFNTEPHELDDECQRVVYNLAIHSEDAVRISEMRTHDQVVRDSCQRDWRFRWLWRLTAPSRWLWRRRHSS